MMQHDWEPLSHGELDQRLDQAVEEILEAELMANVQAQAQSHLLLQVSQLEEPMLHLQTQSQDIVHPQVVFQLADMLAVSPNTDNDLQRQSAEKAEENPAVQVGYINFHNQHVGLCTNACHCLILLLKFLSTLWIS